MPKPIAVKANGICFAFPDICKTTVGPATVPIPYPNIGKLSDAKGTSTSVFVGDKEIILQKSEIKKTTGDEPGKLGGVRSGVTEGCVEFVEYSMSVSIEDSHPVRMLDRTQQNDGNATGVVLGGDPSVLVGD